LNYTNSSFFSQPGCHRLAEFYSTIKRDDAKGAEIYKQNCDELKYGQSCFSYAAKRVHGKGKVMYDLFG